MADAYSANVVACVRFGSPGAVTTIGDKTGAFDWTGSGNAAQVAEGDALTGFYLSLDGTGDYLSTPGRPSFRLGSGAFVIDFGIKTTAAGDVILDYTGSTTGYRVDMAYPAGSIRFLAGRSTIVKVGTASIADGARKHVAIVRSSDKTLRIFINGVLDASTTDNTNYSADVGVMAIGAQVSDRDGTNDLTGKIDFLRITVGTDRGWTSAFTPPTLADIGFQYSAESTAALSASDSAQPYARWNVNTLDQVNTSGAINAAYHYTMTESVAFSSAASPTRLAQATTSQGIMVADSFASKGYLSGSITNDIAVSDTAKGNLKANAAIAETVALNVAELLSGSLDDLITTWVANLATSAHSRYSQYGFNSFAFFDGHYYGCKSDGIYELSGALDGTAPIPWTVTFAETDFGSTMLKRVANVIVGAKSSGPLALKVVHDPAHIYAYPVTPSGLDARASRVKIGKGLKSRYWQFELASDVERVELEAIDYQPEVMSRHI